MNSGRSNAEIMQTLYLFKGVRGIAENMVRSITPKIAALDTVCKEIEIREIAYGAMEAFQSDVHFLLQFGRTPPSILSRIITGFIDFIRIFSQTVFFIYFNSNVIGCLLSMLVNLFSVLELLNDERLRLCLQQIIFAAPAEGSLLYSLFYSVVSGFIELFIAEKALYDLLMFTAYRAVAFFGPFIGVRVESTVSWNLFAAHCFILSQTLLGSLGQILIKWDKGHPIFFDKIFADLAINLKKNLTWAVALGMVCAVLDIVNTLNPMDIL